MEQIIRKKMMDCPINEILFKDLVLYISCEKLDSMSGSKYTISRMFVLLVIICSVSVNLS